MRKSIYLFIALMSLGTTLAACRHSVGDINIPPEPPPEEKATCWLYDVLMSDSGYAMTAEKLAQLKEEEDYERIGDLALPLNKEDVLPRMGTYKNDKTGGTIVFKPYKNDKDTLNPVCMGEFRVPWHSWEDSCYLPADTCERGSIENRGKGILAIYRIVHNFGPNGGRHRCYEDHPDGYPEYWGALMYVYPGADSLLFTVGYVESKRVYRFIKP